MRTIAQAQPFVRLVLVFNLLLSFVWFPNTAPPADIRDASTAAALKLAADVARGTSLYTATVPSADSAAQAATINASAAPTTSITAPLANATIKGSYTVTANADDDVGVTLVEFYYDGIRFADDTVAPYSAQWDTMYGAEVYDGTHVLTTRAYDADGQVTTSAPVTITVANTVGTIYRATFTSSAVPGVVAFDAASTTQQPYPVDVTMTNKSTYTWTTGAISLLYRWVSPDPATMPDVWGPITPLTSNVAANASLTMRVTVAPPALPANVDRSQYRLRFDLYQKLWLDQCTESVDPQAAQHPAIAQASRAQPRAATTPSNTTAVYPAAGCYTYRLFAARGNPPLENPVIANKLLMDEAIGLERYYHYIGEEVGVGMQHLVNIANGNSLLRWTPFQSPGRGLATVVDLTYNTLEKKSDSSVGNNFSLSISGLTRLGLPLDIHPNNADTIAGRANRWIGFTDGDGTTHRFEGVLAADGSVYWKEPAGVNLYLRTYSTTDATRRWALTRPDRVTFFFDSDGYPTGVEDLNGNRITFTLATVPPGEDPGGLKKRVTAVTDAAGQGTTPAPNRSFLIDYYSKDEAKKPQVRGKIQRITDHTGSALDFEYYEDGNLLRMIQRGGTKANGAPLADRRFIFTYTTSNGDAPAIPDPAARANPNPKSPNQSVYLYSVRDPRGSETIFAYCGTQPGTTCDPNASQNRWKLRARTNRTGSVTAFAYDITNRVTTVTNPLSRVSKYAYNTQGSVVTLTNPLNQATTVQWSADRKVTRVSEPTGQYTEFAYNLNSYITDRWDQLRNRTTIEYQNIAVDANDVSGKWEAGRTIPHISQPIKKTNPRGTATASPLDDYQWSFTYDVKGNLITAVDPVQRALIKATSYTYNPDGTLKTQTDANGRTTTYATYDANGLPTTVIDAKGQTTKLGYDDGLLR